tara:strand:+ start:863 stop:1126 length:264 start_codon:yes stop_codon:yes gene_type:complete
MFKILKENSLGFIGMILIHSSTFPTIIGHIMGTSKTLPPLEMILLIFFGLAFYLVDSIKRKLWVYIISNSIGFASQLTLLTIYTFGG